MYKNENELLDDISKITKNCDDPVKITSERDYLKAKTRINNILNSKNFKDGNDMVFFTLRQMVNEYERSQKADNHSQNDDYPEPA